jgi:hypothetical protein
MLHTVTPNMNSTAVQISPEDEVYTDTGYPQSVWRQFQVLCRRSFLCSQRDKVCYNNIGKLPVLEMFLRNLNKTEKSYITFRYSMTEPCTVMYADSTNCIGTLIELYWTKHGSTSMGTR